MGSGSSKKKRKAEEATKKALSSKQIPPPPASPPVSKSPIATKPQMMPSLPDGPQPLGPVRTVILLGETGSGKSTFVNYLANFFLQGDLRALKVVIPNKIYRNPTETGYANHSEANLDDTSISQTRKCSFYSFSKGAVTYRFIDTPGLSDTSNSAEHCVDDESINTILLAASEAGELHAIVLIINGTIARLTVNMRNALKRISSNYPDVLLNNMLVVYTNTSSSGKSFDDQSLTHQPKQTFVMNNSAFSSLYTEWNEDDVETQELFWKGSMKKIGELIALIDKLAPQSTEVFREMLAKRNEIRSHIFRATTEIEKQQQLVEKLEHLKREVAVIQSSANEERAKSEFEEMNLKLFLEQQKLMANARITAESDKKAIQAQLNDAESQARQASNKLQRKKQKLKDERQRELPSNYYIDSSKQSFKQHVPTPYHNTLCRHCIVTCHARCGLSFSNVVGDKAFLGCACMNGGRRCGRCGCGPEWHVHDMYIIEDSSEAVNWVNQAKKIEYMAQQKKFNHLQDKVTNWTHRLNAAQAEVTRCNGLLSNVSTHTQAISQDENRLNLQKDDALKKKTATEKSLILANKRKAEIESQLAEAEAKLQQATETLKRAQNIIIVKCEELKTICSHFDFVGELKVTRESLQLSLATLKSSQAREKAEGFIGMLGKLADGLMA